MEQTKEKLKEVVQKIEEATELYQEIVKKMGLLDQDKKNPQPSIKTMKVLVNEKRTVLEPSFSFEDINDQSTMDAPYPLGHMVTSFYYRSPIQPNPAYQTEPVSLKPWLAHHPLK
ncbi:hypothetical protein [Alkalihalobacillus deserti]|uniref:hypothetical protein n=1 Tax=Alkalihalobacillus deserti TaxID=2879466 RepID=UPI001D13EFB0|nr:hypothetical protein [Alkalihalobacillus deserti]